MPKLNNINCIVTIYYLFLYAGDSQKAETLLLRRISTQNKYLYSILISPILPRLFIFNVINYFYLYTNIIM